MKTYFLYDKEENADKIEKLSEKLSESFEDLKASPFPFEGELEEESLAILMIDDFSFKEFLLSLKKPVFVGILPYEKNPLTVKNFNIPSKTEEALELIRLREGLIDSNILVCNENAVFDCVNIGDERWIEDKNPFEVLETSLIPLLVETRERSLKTASFLVEISSEAYMQRKRAYFFKESENMCDRISCVIYSPKSVTEAFWLRYFFARKKSSSKTLPDGIGTIKSDYLKISSLNGKEFSVSFEGRHEKAKEIVLENKEISAKIITGWKGCVKSKERKESLRIQNVFFDDEMMEFYQKRRLPFVKIAPENLFAELFTKLKEASKGGVSYAVLLILSVLMATTGLFQNSSPTIIGAMILAPLMGPIVSFSMGAVRFDGDLLKRSFKTILLSVFFAVFASAVFAFLMPFHHINDQMALRTHPTLLDLAVAVISGIAAAYGYSNSKVGESLAGVAIAVALVPPLCVSGIGLGWGSLEMFSNAFLLFLTNMVGIVFAAGVTFYLLGYASVKYASTAFFVKILMVLIVAFPLYFSTKSIVEEEKIYQKISKITVLDLEGKKVKIELLGVFHKKEGIFAEILILSSSPVKEKEMERIAKEIKEAAGDKIKLIFRYAYLR